MKKGDRQSTLEWKGNVRKNIRGRKWLEAINGKGRGCHTDVSIRNHQVVKFLGNFWREADGIAELLKNVDKVGECGRIAVSMLSQ